MRNSSNELFKYKSVGSKRSKNSNEQSNLISSIDQEAAHILHLKAQ